MSTPVQAADTASCPWMDKTKSPEQRADLLIHAMTLDQKLHETTFSDPPWFTHYGTAGHVDGDASLCLPDINMSDAGSVSSVVSRPPPSSRAASPRLRCGTRRSPAASARRSARRPTPRASTRPRYGHGHGPHRDERPQLRIRRRGPVSHRPTTAAAIQGIQSNPVLAEAKHYLLNDQERPNTVDVTRRRPHDARAYLAPLRPRSSR